jgi:hypothetical protein
VVCIAAAAAIATAETEDTLAVAGFAVRSSLAEAARAACSAEAVVVEWASPVADSVEVSVRPAVVPARPVVVVVCSVRRPVR